MCEVLVIVLVPSCGTLPDEVHIPNLEKTGNLFPKWGVHLIKAPDLRFLDHSLTGCDSVDISTPLHLQADPVCPTAGSYRFCCCLCHSWWCWGFILSRVEIGDFMRDFPGSCIVIVVFLNCSFICSCVGVNDKINITKNIYSICVSSYTHAETLSKIKYFTTKIYITRPFPYLCKAKCASPGDDILHHERKLANLCGISLHYCASVCPNLNPSICLPDLTRKYYIMSRDKETN